MLHVCLVEWRLWICPEKLKFECLETQILSYTLLWPHFSLWLQEYLDFTWNKVSACRHRTHTILWHKLKYIELFMYCKVRTMLKPTFNNPCTYVQLHYTPFNNQSHSNSCIHWTYVVFICDCIVCKLAYTFSVKLHLNSSLL